MNKQTSKIRRFSDLIANANMCFMQATYIIIMDFSKQDMTDFKQKLVYLKKEKSL